jgi:hypothetical protein
MKLLKFQISDLEKFRCTKGSSLATLLVDDKKRLSITTGFKKFSKNPKVSIYGVTIVTGSTIPRPIGGQLPNSKSRRRLT